MVLRVQLAPVHEEQPDGTWSAVTPCSDTTGTGATPEHADQDLAEKHARRNEADEAYRDAFEAMLADPPPEWPVDYIDAIRFQEMMLPLHPE